MQGAKPGSALLLLLLHLLLAALPASQASFCLTAEGRLMNDFTGRIKRDEWRPPAGFRRTLTCALDTAQYQLDMDALAARRATEDVYASFNLLMRRKPKVRVWVCVSVLLADVKYWSLSVSGTVCWLLTLGLLVSKPLSSCAANPKYGLELAWLGWWGWVGWGVFGAQL